jgi:hypothetical protein
MTNTAATANMRNAQTPGPQESLGSYPLYAEAQSVVDYLSDQHFEVETTQIVGSRLRMIEQITGRLTWIRALSSGAASGAWFGALVGVLLNILSTVSFWMAIALGVTWGAIFGFGFAAVGYGMTAGRRDFTSRSVIVPSRFEVLVEAGRSERARALLAERPGRLSSPASGGASG